MVSKLTNIEHFREVLAQMMRSSSLDGSTTGWNISLNSRGEVATCKLLVLSFSSFHYWDGQQVCVYLFVEAKDFVNLMKEYLMI